MVVCKGVVWDVSSFTKAGSFFGELIDLDELMVWILFIKKLVEMYN